MPPGSHIVALMRTLLLAACLAGVGGVRTERRPASLRIRGMLQALRLYLHPALGVPVLDCGRLA